MKSKKEILQALFDLFIEKSNKAFDRYEASGDLQPNQSYFEGLLFESAAIEVDVLASSELIALKAKYTEHRKFIEQERHEDSVYEAQQELNGYDKSKSE